MAERCPIEEVTGKFLREAEDCDVPRQKMTPLAEYLQKAAVVFKARNSRAEKP